MVSPAAELTVAPALTAAEVAEVLALAAAASRADRVAPLGEHVELHLRHGGDPRERHLLARTPAGVLVGYAHLDPTDPVAGPAAELVVAPDARRQGVGAALLHRLLELSAGRLRLWAHGSRPGAAALAASAGLTRSRELLQLRRPLVPPLPEVVVPEGLLLRTFVPGRDDEAWVALNAEVFATHPEQGRITLADLHQRMAEPWFDPSGFFLAERAGELLGYGWAKVHGEGHPALGELYVLGVSAAARGLGLGRTLTTAVLQHVAARGVPTAMLYADADNTPALRVYTGLGFTVWASDTMFSTVATG
ncbi:mycothiol synthase [Motilibacter rhizosphaerae]|uniref:Mycothiol acetyltransferase n=1 Tax=Motilibacter rhizosphaerae TaxID=598652 RepID=A0A4Q7NWJ8_9ACTN|nr:mycothiol synthase [Motilibacter rhizosphaerae]RZS90782.1 mycothiol synthase [Motilibacter rhizosphaerae]